MTRRLARLADITYRRRRRVVLAWIAATVVIIGVGSALAGEYEADYHTPGSDSKEASEITQENFEGYSGQEINVVWEAEDGAGSPATLEQMDAFFADAEQVEHVSKHAEIRISDDGTIGTTTLPLTVNGWEVEKEHGEELIAAAEDNSGDGLEIKLGGDPIYAAQEQASPEGFGLLGGAIVLLIAFGSVVAAGLPLVIALVGLGISSAGLIALLANVVDVPDWTTAVSGLIGIGVGIDYALLVLTRFRAAMSHGKDVHDAVTEAVTTAGRSVLIAGATVVIAIFGLVLTGLPYMVGVAISASLAVLVVMLAAVTLLPALLSMLGPRVDKLKIPFLGGRALRAEGDSHSPAARWSHAVQRRPWPAAILATVLLIALALPALDMRLGFPDAGNDKSGVDDPRGLRPHRGGLRPGHQRPARDRRRAACGRTGCEAGGKPVRAGASRRGQRRVRCAAAVQRSGNVGDHHDRPGELATGRGDRGAGHPPPRRPHPRAARTGWHQRPGGRPERGARGPERLHRGQGAARVGRRGRALLPAPARGLPLAADLAEGGHHEPALGGVPASG